MIKAYRFIATPLTGCPAEPPVGFPLGSRSSAQAWGILPPPATGRGKRDAALSLTGAPHPAQLESAGLLTKCMGNTAAYPVVELAFSLRRLQVATGAWTTQLLHPVSHPVSA